MDLRFEDGDVAIAANGHYWGIVTTSPKEPSHCSEDLVTCHFSAIKHGEQGLWEVHSPSYSTGEMQLHPDPEAVLRDFTRASLLGEVRYDHG